ncbi:hypothetical protein J3P89_18285 [Pseudomonas sp. Z1-14]|uniref:hypothetical protein n=1 Tax=Pseudomonas sp. Z1-14 TaxID=2817409 RepID=UPI003DA8B1E6
MTATGKTLPALIFGAGLALIAIDTILFLFDWPHAGLAFCIGLAGCAVSAVLGERAKTEDVLILLAAAALLTLVAIRSL